MRVSSSRLRQNKHYLSGLLYMKSWNRNETYRLDNSCFPNEFFSRQNNLLELLNYCEIITLIVGRNVLLLNSAKQSPRLCRAASYKRL